jgi:hypothetical protein
MKLTVILAILQTRLKFSCKNYQHFGLLRKVLISSRSLDTDCTFWKHKARHYTVVVQATLHNLPLENFTVKINKYIHETEAVVTIHFATQSYM